MSRRSSSALTTLAALTTLTLPLVGIAKPFRQGSLRPSISAGGNSDGFGAGIGAAYCIIDGLEVEASVFHWFGDPSYTQLSPGLRYVFLQVPTVHPYLGAFYRRQFVHDDRYTDGDFVGGRTGVFFGLAKRTYIGLGVGYERRLSCDDADDIDGDGEDGDCDGVFPELLFTVSL